MEADEEFEARVRADIARHGWHVALVPPEAGTPGWALSIGLFERFGHPELVVFGPDLAVLGRLVNHLGAWVRDGAHFEAGSERSDVLAGQTLAFREVAPKWIEVFLGNAAWHYRSQDFPALQGFWPDPGGRFPWDPACDLAWRADQPLLFHAETHRALSERLVDLLRREGAL
jgi:hypothetical protein